MTNEYTKSLATNFGGNLLLGQFHDEILAEGGITTNFKGLTQTLDIVSIFFESALSGGESTTLDTLISAHTPDTAEKRINSFRVYPEIRRVRSNYWTVIGSFGFQGTVTTGIIKYVDILSSIDSSSEMYDINVISRESNILLAEGTFSNKLPISNELTILTSFPSNKGVLEILIKSSGKKRTTVNIQEIIFWY